MRIAIVDDDAALGESVASSLTASAWHCGIFGDGRSFLAMLHRESYDA